MWRKFALVTVALLAIIGLLSLASVAVLAVGFAMRPPVVSRAVHDAPKPIPPQSAVEERYLETLKRALTRYGLEISSCEASYASRGALKRLVSSVASRALRARGKTIAFCSPVVFKDAEEGGMNRALNGETMVGLKRLDNVQFCVTDVIRRKVPGDLIECGAWRGGVCILMRAILAAYGVKDRVVWVSDSFEGLPMPDEVRYSEDHIWRGGEMAVSLEEVQGNFKRYGLLDEQVRFLKGFFKDTLPRAPIARIAVLRIDGDLYESVTETLEYMYPKVSAGGYIILDDYGDHLPPARKAVDDYRRAHGITTPIERIDYSGAFWRKGS